MYKIKFAKSFLKDIKKLDKPTQILLKNWIQRNLVDSDNPFFKGKRLKGSLSKYWRYRVGNYRILVNINDNELIILLCRVGHRKSIYKILDS